MTECSSTLSMFYLDIRSTIFNFLDLKSLKVIRLVSTLWRKEGARILSKKQPWISIDFETLHLKLPAIADFLSHYDIHHNLRLSFQTRSWVYSRTFYSVEEESAAFLKFTKRAPLPARIKYESLICETLLPTIGALVTELRLEMTYFLERDVALLRSTLSMCNNCRKLSLDIVDYEDRALLATEEGLLPGCVESLMLRFQSEDNCGTPPKRRLSLAPCTKFLAACASPNLTFLDLNGFFQRYSVLEDKFGKHLWLEALKNICSENPSAFPKLTGLRKPLLSGHLEIRNLLQFPNGLSHLHIFYHHPPIAEDRGVDRVGLKEMGRVVETHSSSLQTLDIFWGVQRMSKVDRIALPKLPKLTKLVWTTGWRCDGSKRYYCDESRDWINNTMDGLSLRQIFMEGPSAMNRMLPKLTTLSVFLLHMEEENMNSWEHIFPSNLTPILQLQVLNLSLIADCKDSQLLRLHTIFPSLRILRHIRPAGKNIDEHISCCEHVRIDNRSSVIRPLEREWGWPVGKQGWEYAERVRYLLDRKDTSSMCFWY